MLGGWQVIFNFDWWKQEDHREGAKAIVDVLKVVVPALLAVILGFATWFGWAGQDDAGDKPRTPAIEVTGTGNAVQTGSGTQIVQGDNGSVVIGMSIDQHEAILTRRMTELRGDLERATDAERQLIESELAAVSEKLADLETSYAEAVEELHQLRLRLAEFEGEVAPDRLEAAQQALFEGDRSLADELLAQVEDAVADTVKVAADAAYLRGEIAEQEVRWHDAAQHYGRAARLYPNWETVRKAWEFARRSGDFGKAYRYGEDLVELARDGEDKGLLAHALTAHGLVLKDMGRYSDAEGLLREAVEISKATIGEMDPDYAADLNNLALAVAAQGRQPEAEGLYRQALKIGKATFGEGHPKYATTLSNLALAVAAQDRYEEAEVLSRQALAINRATIGRSHPDYSTDLGNLARVVQAQGRYVEAEALYREALEIDRSTIGEGHPKHADHLANLGNLLRVQGKVAEARQMLAQALAIFRDMLPADHPYIAETQRRLDALPPAD